MQVVSTRPGALRVGLLLLTAALLTALPAAAQSYTVIHAFDGTEARTPSPRSSRDRTATYGTTSADGAMAGARSS